MEVVWILVFDVLPVQEHLPLLHVVEPLDQRSNGGLPCPALTHQSDSTTRGDLETEGLEHHLFLLARIVELDIPELDVALSDLSTFGFHLILHQQALLVTVVDFTILQLHHALERVLEDDLLRNGRLNHVVTVDDLEDPVDCPQSLLDLGDAGPN